MYYQSGRGGGHTFAYGVTIYFHHCIHTYLYRTTSYIALINCIVFYFINVRKRVTIQQVDIEPECLFNA